MPHSRVSDNKYHKQCSSKRDLVDIAHLTHNRGPIKSITFLCQNGHINTHLTHNVILLWVLNDTCQMGSVK